MCSNANTDTCQRLASTVEVIRDGKARRWQVTGWIEQRYREIILALSDVRRQAKTTADTMFERRNTVALCSLIPIVAGQPL